MATSSTVAGTADNAYRRGVVLGLTVAEIFLLLLFLLLLAFLALDQRQGQERQERVAELQNVQEQLAALEAWTEVAAKFEEPDEVVILRRGEAAKSGNPELIAEEAKKRAEEAEERARDGQKKAEEAEARAREAEERAREAEARAKEAEAQAEEQARKAEVAQRELRVQEKGHNPPCWYEMVQHGDGWRERAHHLLDVAICDDGIVVEPRAIPAGGAEDDGGGSYAAEAQRLGIANLPYGIPLTNAEFVERLHPLHLAGKEGRVRTYSCVFSVQVWDWTSEDNKVRWKEAHDRVIEGLFSAVTVRYDPWPASEPCE